MLRTLSVALAATALLASGCNSKPTTNVVGEDYSGESWEIVVQVKPANDDAWPKSEDARRKVLGNIKSTLKHRLRGMQLLLDEVSTVGSSKIIVKISNSRENIESIVKMIETKGNLEFYHLADVRTQANSTAKWRLDLLEDGVYLFTDPDKNTISSKYDAEKVLKEVVNADKVKPVLTGAYLKPNSKANLNQVQQLVVNIKFNEEGTKMFREFTSSHTNEILAVFFDGKLVTAPTINGTISDGKAEITGFANISEAVHMADLLNAGVLPTSLEVVSRKRLL